MYILILIAAFIAGMYIENKYSLRVKIKENHLGFQYKDKSGGLVFKKFF